MSAHAFKGAAVVGPARLRPDGAPPESRRWGKTVERARAVTVRLAVLLPLCASADRAQAICNRIPGTSKSFNADAGAANRPFAAPGERLEVALRACDSASPGLTATAADHLVTVVFQPPTGAANAVVLTADADCNAL